MKSIFLLLISFFTIAAYAQQTEGHITYKMSFSGTGDQAEMMAKMFDGSSYEIYFKDNKSRSESKMGSMMSNTTIADENGSILILMDGMMGKKAILTTTDEMKKTQGESPEMNVELLDETKTIAGYTCKKAVVTDEDGNEMIFWYTDQISVPTAGQKYMNSKIPGTPLQYQISTNGVMINFEATTIEKTVPSGKKAKDFFSMNIPEGYTQITMDELMMGAGM